MLGRMDDNRDLMSTIGQGDGSLRHEFKYFLGQADYRIMSGILRQVLSVDPHGSGNHEYWIRSLYFDTSDFNDYNEKLIGVGIRKKIRLRLYHLDQQEIKLEIKNRRGELMAKEVTHIDRGKVAGIIAGNHSLLLDQPDDPVAAKVFYFFSRDYYHPASLVDYEREAYTYPIEDVRITFDKNIRASGINLEPFSEKVVMNPVFQEETVVMEVKFNRFLPGFIRDLLANCAGVRDAISKYCLSRMHW